MRAVGLLPSNTGEPGGRDTGQQVTNYIDGGGPFDLACADLLRQGFTVRYHDRARDRETVRKKAESKTKYSCPGCGFNAWGKPDIKIVCATCEQSMLA